jgi:hypothetical protein
MPFKGTKRFEEGPPHHSVEAGLLGRESNDERLPIDDEGYIGEKSIIEDTLHTYNFGLNTQHTHNRRTSLEEIEPLPTYSLQPERNISNVSKPGTFILPKNAFRPVEPLRIAMKPVVRTNTGNNTMSSGPYSPNSLRIINITDPIHLNDGSSAASTLYDSNLTEITTSGIRVMQPAPSKSISTTVKTSTTISTTTSATTMMAPLNIL